MLFLLIKIFLVSFFINLLYEVLHSILYKTCLEAKTKKYVYLILKGALFDGFSISIIYFLSYLIFKNTDPFKNYYQLILFIIVGLLFAFLWEVYSIKRGKWEYSKKMPLIFKVGLTPFLQLAL